MAHIEWLLDVQLVISLVAYGLILVYSSHLSVCMWLLFTLSHYLVYYSYLSYEGCV